jgi:predicted permease
VGELLRIFIDNIAPVFLVAAAGFLVGRRLRIEPQSLSRLIFNIFSPALVFQSLSTTGISLAELGQLILVMGLVYLCMALIAYLVMRWQGSSPADRAGVVLSAVAPNNGNLGLPVINFAFGPEVLARAVVVFVAMTILNNTVGVFIASSGHSGRRESIMKIFRVPAFYAVVTGLLVRGLGITLPLALERSVNLLADASIPAMLVLLGLQLAQFDHVERLKLTSVGAALRLLVAPLVASGLAFLLSLSPQAAVAVILQASMPVGVFTSIFASEFDLDRQLSLSIILVSTLFSPITLSVLILLLRQSIQLTSY